jgi:hypothetical protein
MIQECKNCEKYTVCKYAGSVTKLRKDILDEIRRNDKGNNLNKIIEDCSFICKEFIHLAEKCCNTNLENKLKSVQDDIDKNDNPLISFR